MESTTIWHAVAIIISLQTPVVGAQTGLEAARPPVTTIESWKAEGKSAALASCELQREDYRAYEAKLHRNMVVYDCKYTYQTINRKPDASSCMLGIDKIDIECENARHSTIIRRLKADDNLGGVE